MDFDEFQYLAIARRRREPPPVDQWRTRQREDNADLWPPRWKKLLDEVEIQGGDHATVVLQVTRYAHSLFLYVSMYLPFVLKGIAPEHRSMRTLVAVFIMLENASEFPD